MRRTADHRDQQHEGTMRALEARHEETMQALRVLVERTTPPPATQ